jgi:hypothetical protein
MVKVVGKIFIDEREICSVVRISYDSDEPMSLLLTTMLMGKKNTADSSLRAQRREKCVSGSKFTT